MFRIFFPDLCQNVKCKYGARCDAGQCVCPTSCPITREPVCATNGVTYINECELEAASCSLNPSLAINFVGECSEASSSGVISEYLIQFFFIYINTFASECLLLEENLMKNFALIMYQI